GRALSPHLVEEVPARATGRLRRGDYRPHPAAGRRRNRERRAPRRARKRFSGRACRLQFIAAGRILAGARTKRRTTLVNCFVMGYIEDSIESIFEHLKQGEVTMRCGGGIGVD